MSQIALSKKLHLNATLNAPTILGMKVLSPPSLEYLSTPFTALPTRLSDLLGFSVSCPCGRRHSVELVAASIRPGATDDLPAFVRAVGSNLTVLVTADRVTAEILGNRVQRMLGRDGHTVGLLTVPDGEGGRPHATAHALLGVKAALQGADLAVAVGSGTINDLTKLASFELGLPYIAAATAPSMNGYTSAIAAMMIDGVKRTVPCAQPVAVTADLDILMNAPAHLIAAGLGDLESKPTATADYRLGAVVRGDGYCSAPESVVLEAEAKVAQTAEGLSSRDPEAIAALTEALILSGLSMKLAGSSAPASGGEHLISHFWDMTAAAENRVEGFHGAQVGMATIVTAQLYEALAALSPTDIDPDRIVAARFSIDAEIATIRKIHHPFDAEVCAEYEKKHPSDETLKERLHFLKNDWSALFEGLSDVLRKAGCIREILSSAGAPVRVTDLSLTPAHLERAFRYARHIRDRYTVLDLAHDVGLLEDAADEILRRSGCLG